MKKLLVVFAIAPSLWIATDLRAAEPKSAAEQNAESAQRAEQAAAIEHASGNYGKDTYDKARQQAENFSKKGEDARYERLYGNKAD